MSDEMPSNRNRGRVDLRDCFLNPILTDVAKSGIPSRLNCISAVGLGNRNDRDLLTVPAALDCRCDSRPHIGHALSQAGESHSCQI
jgi:hypothetical protein